MWLTFPPEPRVRLHEALPSRVSLGQPPEGIVISTGQEINLTEQEEADLAKEALRETIKMEITAADRREDALITSVINAAGWAVGIGIAGVAIAFALGLFGEEPKSVGITG